MNLLNRMMSYDKTKNENQECNCDEYVSVENAELENQTVKYPKLSEEEIERIISERYSYKDEKTKNFIRKALRKHGNRYDYSNVVYVRTDEKVEIICRVEGHESFLQTPHNHLRKQGCLICSGKRKLTLEEFIRRAREVHGYKYNYDKVKYLNIHTKVIIICPKHGEFKQIPKDHLNGHGCLKCQHEKLAKEQTLTLDEFIKRAKEIHGVEKYDYSEVNYINYQTKVIIICRKHKKPYKFSQTPHNHLNGVGCPKCRASKGEITISNFLIKNKIEFEEEKWFKNCRNKFPLPFDFYLPQYNLCIEYDGQQHFIPIDFSFKMTEKQKLENFKQLKTRDKIKTDYCKSNNINLLRIRYDENIEEKLTEYFQKHGIIKEQTLFEMVS